MTAVSGAIDLVMPKLGLTMTEGTIVAWHVEPGTVVAAGHPVAVVSTDKVEADVEAPVDGILEPVAAVGDTLPCGAVLARLAAAGPNNGRRPVSPKARRVAADLGVDLASVDGTGPGGRVTSEDVERVHASSATPTSPTAPSRPSESPAPNAPLTLSTQRRRPLTEPATPQAFSHMAAATAARLGFDVTAVPGSGPGGCVTRDDVYTHARRLLEEAAASPAPEPVLSPGPPTVVPFTGSRKLIAERMHVSLAEMAQVTVHMTVPFDRAVVLTAELREAAQSSSRPAPGFTDLVVAAAARALSEHPRLNSRLTDAGIELQPAVHVGVAVAVDDGLVVPVIRYADRLRLFEIAARSWTLAEEARTGRLHLEDLEGATFCVSPLGMFGVDWFTPVINPPNAAILGIGRRYTGTRWRDGQPEPAETLPLSLTFDHRIVDGAPAARYLQRVAQLLEYPAALLA